MSGVKFIDIVKFVLDESLSGFEFVCGIFGFIGGVLYMNVGVYGGEISDVLEVVIVLI